MICFKCSNGISFHCRTTPQKQVQSQIHTIPVMEHKNVPSVEKWWSTLQEQLDRCQWFCLNKYSNTYLSSVSILSWTGSLWIQSLQFPARNTGQYLCPLQGKYCNRFPNKICYYSKEHFKMSPSIVLLPYCKISLSFHKTVRITICDLILMFTNSIYILHAYIQY